MFVAWLALAACEAAEEPKSPSFATEPEPLDPRAPPEVADRTDDWPLPNHDYDNTRNASTAINSTNIGRLREHWHFEVDTTSSFYGYLVSNPLVLGEQIYFQDLKSNVYALNRNTGDLVWRRLFEEQSSGPNGVAIGWGKVFSQVGGDKIQAIDLVTGEDVWTHRLELQRSEGIDIQPTVFDRQLFASTVPVSQTSGVYAPGSRGVLFSIDVETGERRWSFDTVLREPGSDPRSNGGGGAWYPPLIAAQRGLSYWGTGNPAPFPDDGSRPGSNLYTSSVVAIDLNDGTLAWHYQDIPHDIFDWDFQATPVHVRAAGMSGADLVIGAGKTGAVAALDAGSGRLRWRTKVGKHFNAELNGEGKAPVSEAVSVFPGAFGGVLSAMAYADGVLYVPSTDLPLSYDGKVVVPEFSGGTGSITALDVRDGSVLWVAATAAGCYGAATVANDLVLTSDENGRVYAFARDSGEEVWHYDAPAGINAPLVVAGDAVFVSAGVGMGVVVALKLDATPAREVASSSRGDTAVPARDGTFTAVYRDVIQGAGCMAGPVCHGGPAGGLQMSTRAAAYAALVNVQAMGTGGGETSCRDTQLMRVAPDDPHSSLLVQKLERTSVVCGGPMPPGEPLSDAQIDQVRRWIESGANDD